MTMAKLCVAPELLLQLLFPDQLGLVLHGASFDSRAMVVLDLSGPGVPDVPEVIAEVQCASQKTVFKQAG